MAPASRSDGIEGDVPGTGAARAGRAALLRSGSREGEERASTLLQAAAVLLLMAALAACGPRTARPAGKGGDERPRIMSMDPCVDAILVRVADPGQVVSISHYSHDPAATSMPPALARRFRANVGTAEEVVAARPDVVLLSPYFSPATRAAIHAAGVRVEIVGVPASIAESLDQIRAIGRIAGHAGRGDALVAQIEAALARAAPATPAPPIPALIRQSGALVPGAGTLADELLAHTGFRNMSADYGLAAWDILPLEPLIARPPALLLTDLSRPRDRPAALMRVTQMRVEPFSDRLLQCAGPNLVEAARRLAAIRRGWGRS